MPVRCIETGKIYRSASAAARDISVSPGAMTHHLKGRQKTCGGYRFEKFTSNNPEHKVRRYKKPIRDDAGNHYDSYERLAQSKGISRNMAWRHVNNDPARTFRNAVLREGITRVTLGWNGQFWRIDNVSYPSRTMAVAALRESIVHFPIATAHRALDKARQTGQSATFYFGPVGWTEDRNAGDLFGGL